ncbi:MAG: TonB-dependent siderophore receptor [Ferruginibacter sp.]|nr:TonB-dependent siderophore receptor [Ferruginibacter sp.]
MCKRSLLTAVVLFIAFVAQSQSNITGKIVTKDGSPAANVNVEVKELRKFSISNEDGRFTIRSVSDGIYHIVVSFTGLLTQQQEISVQQNKTTEVSFVLQENASQLEEVIVNSRKGLNNQPVSAGKVAIDPMDLPQSVTVVGQTVIRDQQAQRLSDVIKNVNGVYLSDARGSTSERFFARGYNLGSYNLFKNGYRVNSGTMPEISSLEKVEILKGSAAILYGNVAPGGIINMVTKQPKFYKGGEISMRAGSYGLWKPSVDIYGPLSANVAFRLNGTYEKAESYRDNVKSERYYLNPSFLFKLGQHTELLVQGDYLHHDFTPDFGIGSINNTIIPTVGRSHFVGTPWQYNKADQTTATVTLKHQINTTWNINASTSYQVYKRDYYSIERIIAAANGDWARPLNKIQSQEDYFIGNIDLVGKFKTGQLEHTFLAGVDADKYVTTSYTFNNPVIYDTINILDLNKFEARTDIPAASKVTGLKTPIKRMGAYVQDLISISSKLKLLAGIRWSMQEGQAATTHYLLKDSIAKGITTKADAFSPRVGLVYRPYENISAFASYANSFSVNSGTDVFGNALQPSIIDQYEIGIKNELLKGKLSINLTLYRIINNNLAQTAPYAADGITRNNNTALKELAGQTTSDGVELDINSQPIKGLNILAGYSFNNMRFTNTKIAKGNYIEGERLVNTPANTANTSLMYTFQKGNFKGLKVGAGAFHTGDRFGGYNNTQQQAQNYSRLIPVAGFTTVDISAGYSFKKASLMVKVSNLFNTYNYLVHENYSINPIAPRQFISTVAFRF